MLSAEENNDYWNIANDFSDELEDKLSKYIPYDVAWESEEQEHYCVRGLD